MNRGYGLGVGLGLLLIVTAGLIYSLFSPPPPINVTFNTNLVDRSHAPVGHGHVQEVVLKLQNRGKGRIRLDALRFSEPFVHAGSSLVLPLWIPPGTMADVPVEVVSEVSYWGQQKVQVRAVVSNRRETHEAKVMVLWDLAAHINPDPPLVQFPRVQRGGTIPPLSIRLWSPQSDSLPEDIRVESLDPAVRVTSTPIETIENGRHYLRELTIEIDARLAQPQHRSQVVVRTNGGGPPIIIPVVGWVDD